MSDQDCVFKGIEEHQLSLNLSVTRIRLSCALWKISAHMHNIKAGDLMLGYPLTAKRMVSFPKPVSTFRGGRWDNTLSDLGLPFLMHLFLLPMAIWEFPTGSGYIAPWSCRVSSVSTWYCDAPQKSLSFKQKKWPHRWRPQPLPLRCRRTKNMLADAWWPKGWKSLQNSCRQRKTISATWISASRKWFSPWETSRWVPGAEDEAVTSRSQLTHVLLAADVNASTSVNVKVTRCREQVQSYLSGKWCARALARRVGSQICCWHLCYTCIKPASRYLPRGLLGCYIPAHGLQEQLPPLLTAL